MKDELSGTLLWRWVKKLWGVSTVFPQVGLAEESTIRRLKHHLKSQLKYSRGKDQRLQLDRKSGKAACRKWTLKDEKHIDI